MSSSKKNTSTGTRYSREQKLDVVAFINQYNVKHGRGGQSAAAKKFKITQLTIAKWLKDFAHVDVLAEKKAKAAKPKPKMKKPKAFGVGKRGARYTTEQKVQVVDFVNEYNVRHGRGGQSQAAQKFGLSVLTVSSWLKSPRVAVSRESSSSLVPSGLNAKFATLIEVSDELRKSEAETNRLRAKYDAIRASIQALI